MCLLSIIFFTKIEDFLANRNLSSSLLIKFRFEGHEFDIFTYVFSIVLDIMQI